MELRCSHSLSLPLSHPPQGVSGTPGQTLHRWHASLDSPDTSKNETLHLCYKIRSRARKDSQAEDEGRGGHTHTKQRCVPNQLEMPWQANSWRRMGGGGGSVVPKEKSLLLLYNQTKSAYFKTLLSIKLDTHTVSFVLIVSDLPIHYKSCFNSSLRSHSFFLTLKFNLGWLTFLRKSSPKQLLSALGWNSFTCLYTERGIGEKWGCRLLWQEDVVGSCRHVLLYIW